MELYRKMKKHCQQQRKGYFIYEMLYANLTVTTNAKILNRDMNYKKKERLGKSPWKTTN